MELRVGNETESILRNTKVLKIKYKDEDKNIILPVLKLISREYQDILGKIEE